MALWNHTEVNISQCGMSGKSRKRRYGFYLLPSFHVLISTSKVPEEGTGMPDEQNYKSYLLSFDEALNYLWDSEKLVLAYAWRLFCNTERQISNMATAVAEQSSAGQQHS